MDQGNEPITYILLIYCVLQIKMFIWLKFYYLYDNGHETISNSTETYLTILF